MVLAMGVGSVEWRWGMTIVIPNPDEYSIWWSDDGLPLEVTTTMLQCICDHHHDSVIGVR